MSLINKMLQELDRRNAIGAADGPVPPQQVRAVARSGAGHEWFWRILALLTLVAVAWVGWVAYQLQPRSLATELALNAGEQARRKVPPAVAKAAPAPKAEAAAPKPEAPAPKPEPAVQQAEAKPAPPPELFKLALAIDRPISARAARPAPKAAAQTPRDASALKAGVDKGAGSVTKRELPLSAENEAELRFRRGVALLNQARVGDAQAEFAAALSKQPGHEASRQALIALLIERRQLDEARRHLEEGLALNPGQTQFAAVLARIMVEGGDFAAAAKVLDNSRNAAAKDAEYQVLHGAVLQRLGRHAEAVEALERSAQIADQPGATWVAMGISYEALGRRSEALTAYRRSLGAGAVGQDVRAYAEGRIRALN